MCEWIHHIRGFCIDSVNISLCEVFLVPTFSEHLLQPQLFLVLQVFHLLAVVFAVLPTAVVHAGAAGGGDREAGHLAGLLRLQVHAAGQFLPAAVEGPGGIRENQQEDFEFVGRKQNHDDAGAETGTEILQPTDDTDKSSVIGGVGGREIM